MSAGDVKAVIVTGASGGIGGAISDCLKDRGYVVIEVDSTSPRSQAESSSFTGDVRSPDLADSVLESACAISGDVSLVNAAGITLPASGEYSWDSWRETISVNLDAVFLWCEAYRLRATQARIRQGAIVNIGSLAAHRGFSGNPAYAASKAGVVGLTRAIAIEIAPYGLRANAISPGYVRTDMTKMSWNDSALREQRAMSSMLQRWAEPMEIARAVAFLLSDDASFVTAACLPVDGGWLSKG